MAIVPWTQLMDPESIRAVRLIDIRCPDERHWKGLGMSSVIFLPSVHRPTLIMRKRHQTRPKGGRGILQNN